MALNYQAPELEIIKLNYDILTSSGDNDAPFSDFTDNDDQMDWGQYY